MHETGLYVFCFAQPGVTVDGVEGVSVRIFESCAAVVAEVLLNEFTGDHLEDLAWLAPRACRHEAVVEAAMRQSAVLPVRFGAVFSGLDSLERFMAAHQERISGFLREAAGREEWGAKALVNIAEMERYAEAAGASADGLTNVPPGTRYLRRKNVRLAAEGPAQMVQERAATAFAEDLGRLACALVARRPLSEPGRRVLKSWAFLVAKQRAEEFRSMADAAASRRAVAGLEFRISGPWPPYSFVPDLPPVGES